MAKQMATSAQRERMLRESAAREADDLFAHHGAAAIGILSRRLVDGTRSADERRADRLSMLAVEKLDRLRRQGGVPQAAVAWKPPLFSRAGFAGLFGFHGRTPRS